MSKTDVKETNVVPSEKTQNGNVKAQTKNAAVKTKKAKKEKKPSKFVKWFKELFSELKKVSWPKFGKVCKQTGVVLAFVVIFGVVLFGFDYLLSYLFNLLV